jgi:hypothetical protein
MQAECTQVGTRSACVRERGLPGRGLPIGGWRARHQSQLQQSGTRTNRGISGIVWFHMQMLFASLPYLMWCFTSLPYSMQTHAQKTSKPKVQRHALNVVNTTFLIPNELLSEPETKSPVFLQLTANRDSTRLGYRNTRRVSPRRHGREVSCARRGHCLRGTEVCALRRSRV